MYKVTLNTTVLKVHTKKQPNKKADQIHGSDCKILVSINVNGIQRRHG